MPNIFIFHGTYGYPEENWFQWLKGELEEIGCNVFVPKFPTPENQNLDNWLKVFKQFEKFVDKDTVLVGHSMGCAFALDILQKLNRKINATFLVAPSISDLSDPEDKFNRLNKTFYENGFEWRKIKDYSNYFYVIGSDTDPYVPLDEMEKVSKGLGVALTVIEGAGHFNTKAGYTQFPQLLDMIEDVLTDL